MNMLWFQRIFFAAIVLLFVTAAATAAEIPSPKDVISDYTNTLDANQIRDLSLKAATIRMAHKTQPVIAIVPDMGGEDVKKYANDMFKQWGIGKKGEDRGLLILVAKKERKIRIETGYGMEGDLPDSKTAMIIKKMGPDLSKGNYYVAFVIAFTEIDTMLKK